MLPLLNSYFINSEIPSIVIVRYMVTLNTVGKKSKMGSLIIDLCKKLRRQNAISLKFEYPRNKAAIQNGTAREEKGKIISPENSNHKQVLMQVFDTSSHYRCDSRKILVNNSI